MDAALGEYGRLDGVILNAGVGTGSPAENEDLARFRPGRSGGRRGGGAVRIRRAVMAAAVVAAALVGGAGCHLEADQAPVTAPQVEQQPAAFTPGTISRGGVTYMVDCEGEPRRSPTTIFVGCPDRYGVRLLRWRGWGTERAVGSRVAIVNRCVPSCSDPALSQYSVTVVLSDVKEGEASAFYTRMTIYGRDAPSAGRPAEDRFLLRMPDHPGSKAPVPIP